MKYLPSFLSIFIITYSNFTNVFILSFTEDRMYLTELKTVSNYTTCFSPTKGCHIRPDDFLVRQSVSS